jgi:hypothetical protein
VDVRCRTHRCRIAVIVRDPDGALVLETAPETVGRGYARVRIEVPWTGRDEMVLPPELGWGCPRGHEKRPGVPRPLSVAEIRAAWQSGESGETLTLTWP